MPVMHQQSNTVTFGHLADVTTDAYNTKVVDLKKLLSTIGRKTYLCELDASIDITFPHLYTK